MRTKLTTRGKLKRSVAAVAALAAIPVLGLASAHSAGATTALNPIEAQGSNETVTKGAYKAVFHHTGSEGETLEVFDNATDGDAAVAYVRIKADRYPRPPVTLDEDRFVVTTGYDNFNLREGDSGPYDIPEGRLVSIMICRGYASIPGDNCSDWETGIS